MAVWLREMPQSLAERFHYNKEHEYFNTLLSTPSVELKLSGFDRFCYHIHKECRRLADKICEIENHIAEKPEPVAATAAKGKKKAGAKGLSEAEQIRRMEILDNWEDASSKGISAKEFAKDHKITVAELNKMVDWDKKRKNRQKPR